MTHPYMAGRSLDRPADSVRLFKDFLMRCTASRDPGLKCEGHMLFLSTNWDVLELLLGARVLGVDGMPDRPKGLDLVHLVALCAGVPAATILSDKKDKQTALVRHIAMHLVRELDEMSYPALGRLFGKDTSTVQYGVKKVARLVGEGHPQVLRVRAQVESSLRLSRVTSALAVSEVSPLEGAEPDSGNQTLRVVRA